MPVENAIPRRPGESDAEYAERLEEINRSQENLDELFTKHYKENIGQLQFASDTKGSYERRKWESQQIEQWDKRHIVMKKLVALGGLRKEEFDHANFHDDGRGELELRQRWLTEDGKKFLRKIINEIKQEGNLWDPPNKTEGLDFRSIEIKNREVFTDFYYVNHCSKNFYRDLRYTDLNKEHLKKVNLEYSKIYGAKLTQTQLSDANLCEADLNGSNLMGAILQGTWLTNTNLEGAWMPGSKLQNARLHDASLQDANIMGAKFQNANLSRANLQGAWLAAANLEGADLTNAIVAGAIIYKTSSHNRQIARIQYKSADFSNKNAQYLLEWRGPLWVAFLMSLITMILSPIGWLLASIWHIWKWQHPIFKHPIKWKKFSWKRKPDANIIFNKCAIKEIASRLMHMIRLTFLIRPVVKTRNAILEFISKKGRPTIFFGINTSLMDASKNPGLKRDIDDEQFINDFHQRHPCMYWLWARSSDCGRSLSLWALWSFIFALVFAVIFTVCPGIIHVDNAKTDMPYPHFLTNLYFSVVTFTTLGFGDISANNLWGALVVGTEVILGYFFLGGLIAILASKLARRS